MDNCEQITRFRPSANDSKDRSTNLHDISSVRSVCAAIKVLPLLAVKRTMHCFSLRSSIQMQSGRSVCTTSEVAQGATSFVYQAEDTVSGQIYALKKIICQSEEQRRMVKHEIQLHRVLKHPNIMPLIDHAEVTGGSICHEYYLLFPFMQEGTLRDKIDISIEQRTSLSERWILDRFLELCKAIAEFHTHTPALAHRDIKVLSCDCHYSMFARDEWNLVAREYNDLRDWKSDFDRPWFRN
uniref:non-specific serine/threonine protein kinase n=1 Tax=Albugo laibachii Nc14 TaxID=890382 RepID=F0WEB7_9STRA|nr:serine/threonine protein kinase putative [Albugo laibachii Nc14]|eukprot:CCA19548.1 serine/threonine protein kinase putative [Albugo laibachii Nc14]